MTICLMPWCVGVPPDGSEGVPCPPSANANFKDVLFTTQLTSGGDFGGTFYAILLYLLTTIYLMDIKALVTLFPQIKTTT
ncbi:hypothetical protein [Nostoc sp.]|uniref:hypothetical protein n=1 Tax=Nostoc sp. TaxID=1180 RepID=UPI002FF4DE36